MLLPLAADCPEFETIILHLVHISSFLYNEYTLKCTHDGMSSQFLRGTCRGERRVVVVE